MSMAEDEAGDDAVIHAASPESFEATRGRRPRWGRRILVIVSAVLVITWLAVSHRPSWWTSGGDRSAAAEARGVAFENAMVREMTAVREGPASWGFVLVDADVNAWLANRLDPWIASRGNIDLPVGVDDPRIRFIDGGIEVGVEGPLGGVATARFKISLDGDDLLLTPGGGGIGLFSLGEASAKSAASAIVEMFGGADGLRLGDVRLEADGRVRMPAVIPLADGRRVQLDDLEIVVGELAVRFRTTGG